VLAVSAAAGRTLRRAVALGVPGFLACPLAHHRLTIELLRDEARRAPEFATTLPSPAILERMSATLDAELELAHRVLTLSTFETCSYVERGVDPVRIVQLPPGVNGDLFRPRPRAEDGAFRVLFVGQLTQRKGLSYLLDAFRLAAIPRSELLLVGAPQSRRRPWTTVEAVRHLPPLPQSELPLVYAAADVYVMPSIVEGSCLTALEAMASGLPVVVSENTGTPDVIEEGREGHVVPIRDPHAIAERLRELHSDPDRRHRMGTAARRRAEGLSWERYGQLVAEALGAAR
jgi:glycosyltransferase involved in cell wall biosynthesis